MKRSFLVLMLIAAWVPDPGVTAAQSAAANLDDPPRSPHFSIERISDGVWAAIASDSGFAISNAAIVDLGDATLIFDPFMTPEAAEDLRSAAETLTGRSVAYVALSHWHNDHIRGSQSFPGAIVVGTSTTRKDIAEREPSQIEAERRVAPARREAVQARLDTTLTDHARREAGFWLAYYDGMLRSHDELVLTLPQITFEGELTIHGDTRDATLIELNGHTESDVILWLSAERIVYMGDLLFVERHPYLPDGDHQKHRAALRSTLELNPDRVVPGHGPVGGAESLQTMIRYLDDVEAQGRALAAAGATEEEARAAPVPQPYAHWWYGNFVPINTWTMTQRARDEEKK